MRTVESIELAEKYIDDISGFNKSPIRTYNKKIHKIISI